MTDIDVLIRTDQRDRSHAVMLQLGYTATHDTLHSRSPNDQVTATPSTLRRGNALGGLTASGRPTHQKRIWQRYGGKLNRHGLYGFPCFALSVPDQLDILYNTCCTLFAFRCVPIWTIALPCHTRRCAHAEAITALARGGKNRNGYPVYFAFRCGS